MLNFALSVQGFLADRLHRDDRGATAVEYGLIVALIAAVIIGAVTALGVNIQGVLNNVAAAIGGI